MAASFERELPRLLDLLYQTALDPTRWSTFLKELPPMFGGANGILQLFDAEARSFNWFIQFNSDPSFSKSYVEHYAVLNPYAVSDLALVPVGELTSATKIVKQQDLARTEFYNDWMHPQGIPEDHFGISLYRDSNRATIFSIAPHVKFHRRNYDEYVRRLNLLSPHLVRAAQIGRLGTIGAGSASAESTIGAGMNALGLAAIVVGRDGRPVHLNKLAEALLRDQNRALTVDRYGALAATNPASAKLLLGALEASLRLGAPGGPIRLIGPNRASELIAWLVPVAPSSQGQPNGMNDTKLRQERHALLLLARSKLSQGVNAGIIAAAFGLSATEALLANALVSGMTLASYAQREQVSPHTARNQLASIFAKTGTHRQAELVAKIMAVSTISSGLT